VRDRYIVPTQRAADFYNGPAAAYFEPSETDVSAFEADLSNFLRATNDSRSHRIAKKLKSYRRQFVGVLRGSNRLIFGNFFCSEEPVTSPVIVDDGGECYFEVLYDPTTRAFSALYIHGEA
jgi:hypothetical protein